MADEQEIRQTRRRQIEQYLASDMSVVQWCKLNKLSKSTFYKWVERFRHEDPDMFADADQTAGNWLEVTRSEMSAAVAIAKVPEEGACAAAPGRGQCGRIVARVAIGAASVEVAAGATESEIAAVLRAVMSL